MTGARPSPRYGYAIVTCVRNEANYIVEWLEYHRSIGFEHVYLYCNDDDPQELAAIVQAYLIGDEPFLTFRYWPHAPDEDFIHEQRRIYVHFLRNHLCEVDRFSFLDVDEFFVLPGRNDISSFIDNLEIDADFLYFNWIVYGNSARIVRDDRSVLLSYFHRNMLADHFTKLICQASAIDPAVLSRLENDKSVFFWHAFDGCGLDRASFRNVLGEPMGGYAHRASELLDLATASPAILAKGYIAHFAFKSENDFAMRAGRRTANSGMWAYMVMSGKYRERLAELNAVFDDTLSRFWYEHLARGKSVTSNIARDKPSWQSSVAALSGEWPRGSCMVGGGNNGMVTGGVGFATRRERNPWWTVDLLAPYRLGRIRVFNRCDDPAAKQEAEGLELWVSGDLSSWQCVCIHRGGPFGGTDGYPWEAAIDGRVVRFVRLQLRGDRRRLHLDEIEIYAHVLDVPGWIGWACSVALMARQGVRFPRSGLRRFAVLRKLFFSRRNIR